MNPQELKTTLGSGLLSFLLTDFNSHGDFNKKGYEKRLKWLSPYGATALFANGGTGEFFSLTGDEYPGIIKTAVDIATDGFYMSPALFSESVASMRINKEQIFGSVASVIKVRDYEEAPFTANDTELGLSAGIATTSLKYATHFKRDSQAGVVMVNLPTAGVDYHVPFGSRKWSSYGQREHGKYAQEFFMTVKTANILA